MEKETTEIPSCYAAHIYGQPISEKQNGITVTIGHMTVCARRFIKELPKEPAYAESLDFMARLNYSLPECKTCCRELTSFRKSIQVDFSKTKRTKEQIREWISGQVRRGCRDFTYDPGYKDTSPMLPNPTVPGFGDYNPDLHIEGKEYDEKIF